jgi:hypothetical protein
MTTERYFLDSDNDGHWYVIPESKQQEWDDWLDLPDDDPKAWTPPEGVSEVGGSPSLVKFTGFEIG